MELRPAVRPQTSGFQQLREVFSQSNPRKRAHPHEVTTSLETSRGNEVLQQDHDQSNHGGGEPSPKRNRTTEWPLKNTIDLGNDGRQSPLTIPGKRPSSRKVSGKRNFTSRASKFQEGSLNDRPSKQPPAAFLEAEDAMERYNQDVGADEMEPTINDAFAEGARPPSTFKFGRLGKAVANVFGFWKDKQPPDPPPKDAIIDDRKAKAEDAYAALKSKGFKGTQEHSSQPDCKYGLSQSVIRGQECGSRPFRDFGVDIDDSRRSSLQTIRTDNLVEGSKPPSEVASKRSRSPTSELIPGRRSTSLHLRTPSFQSLKKVRSQVHMPSIVRTTGKTASTPLAEREVLPDGSAMSLRHQPSKKDIVRQQKLSKKVSDLESKLETARRDLEDSLKDAPPVPEMPLHLARKAFVPGALASLPSERLLNTHSMPSSSPANNPKACEAILGPSGTGEFSSPSRQLGYELNSSIDMRIVNDDKDIEALMSSDPIARPEIDGVNDASWLAAQAAKNRRKSRRRFSEQQLSIEDKIPAGVNKCRYTSTPKVPKNSPTQMKETTPPLPVVSITAEEADRPRSESPFLGRPVATSPVNTRSRSRKSKASSPRSPRQPAALKKKDIINAHFIIHDDREDVALTPDSAAGNRQKQSAVKGSPAPKAVQIRAARAKAIKVSLKEKGGKRLEKPLPKLQSQEDFEWDEDVF